ncbi:YlbL family protein [Herbihabitans rhizosphaerae]|nr:S16 family serine protease [Herbihabitans rhizosphaerae]
MLIVVALGLVGGFVPVPYVALGPGPTYDVLGDVDGAPVVMIDGQPSQPTAGQLRMTTVSLSDDMTLFGALGLWISGRYALAPREDYIKPGETKEQVQKENVKLFQDSQSSAEVAALRYVYPDRPVKVVAGQIVSGGAADKAQLHPGDHLRTVKDKRIGTAADVAAALTDTQPGNTVPIVVARPGQGDVTLQATLEASNDRKQGFLGLTAVERVDVPLKTTIQLKDVGGPSAGLIFALAIVDKLKAGEQNAGQQVAGTGEIDATGKVGAIGGIPFKMTAAKEAGASTFLVPADNCAEAKSRAPDGLRLIKVDTLAGAVTALEDMKAGRPVPGC